MAAVSSVADIKEQTNNFKFLFRCSSVTLRLNMHVCPLLTTPQDESFDRFSPVALTA
jgi:hypothetical protein